MNWLTNLINKTIWRILEKFTRIEKFKGYDYTPCDPCPQFIENKIPNPGLIFGVNKILLFGRELYDYRTVQLLWNSNDNAINWLKRYNIWDNPNNISAYQMGLEKIYNDPRQEKEITDMFGKSDSVLGVIMTYKNIAGTALKGIVQQKLPDNNLPITTTFNPKTMQIPR